VDGNEGNKKKYESGCYEKVKDMSSIMLQKD
jgi:hypothetical protein